MIVDDEVSRPLYSIQAEACLLGCMMLRESACQEALRVVPEEALYRPAHRHIRAAIERLSKRHEAVDLLTVQEELKSAGAYEQAGGYDYLRELDLSVPSASSWPSYAERILELARLRSLEQIGRDLVGRVHVPEDGENAAQIGAWANARLSEIGGSSTGFLRPDEIDESGGDIGYAFGIPAVERVLGTKGVPGGQMSVVVAREKHGKSALKVQMSVHQAQEGLGVLYVTLADLNAKRLKRRQLRAMCGFSERATADFHGFAREFDYAKEALERDMALITLDRTRNGMNDVDDVLGQIESFRQRSERTPVPLSVAYLDYGQKLRSRQFKANDPVGMANYCSGQISTYAERTGLSIIVGSQLTDGNEKEGREPITKGSRQWLEDCGLALWIQRHEGNSATLQILRSRFGGMGTKVAMLHDQNTLSFKPVNP